MGLHSCKCYIGYIHIASSRPTIILPNRHFSKCEQALGRRVEHCVYKIDKINRSHKTVGVCFTYFSVVCVPEVSTITCLHDADLSLSHSNILSLPTFSSSHPFHYWVPHFLPFWPFLALSCSLSASPYYIWKFLKMTTCICC